MHRTQRVFQLAIASVTLVSQPFFFRPPVNILFGFPNVFAPTRKPAGFEAHRLQSAVTREDHQVSPGDFLAVFLLDRPKQHARFVEVGVVGPTVDRRKPLVASATTATTVADAIGTSTMPSHPDKERSIVTVVSGPPVLRRGHQLEDIRFQGCKIETLKRFSVVERLTQGIRPRWVLMEYLQVQLIRPPISIGCAMTSCELLSSARKWAFAFATHSPSYPIARIYLDALRCCNQLACWRLFRLIESEM